MKKTILKKTSFQFKQALPGLTGVDIMANSYPIEPILVFTEYHMNKPVFGPHPHAGISVMTYMLPDSPQGFINRDSLGDLSYIEPGGLHITQAGRGMFHDEFPKETGIDTHGFQIWINHRESDRWAEPKSIHVNTNEMQEVELNDYKVRIIHGEFNGITTDYKMVTDVTLLHIFLYPGKTISLTAKEMAFAYGIRGKAQTDQTDVTAQTLINYNKIGNEIELTGDAEGFEFLFCTATPIAEPLIYGGPFVMTTQEQMRRTQEHLATGGMGELKPYNV